MEVDTSTTARPATDRVLFNIDLLHAIFTHLSHPPTPSPTDPDADQDYSDNPAVEEATLARAAQVCRAFSDPALSVLWSSLPTLFPLWFLLESLRTMGELAVPPQERFRYIITGEISPENWARFCHYAALVREVRLDEITDARMDPSVWPHILRMASGSCFPNLFPRLRALGYALSNPHRTSILLFLAPSLRKLSIYCSWRAADWGPIPRQEAAVSMLVRAACKDCPELHDLKLTMLEFPAPLRVAAEGLRHRLRRLQLGSLEVSDAATIKALGEISTLEQLREIHVKFAPEERLPVRGFRALRDLSIICDAAGDVSKLLACVVAPLESLEICSFAPSSAWQDEFSALVPLVKRSLKSLKVELLPEPTANGPESVHLAPLMQHLVALHNLEVFSLLVRDTDLIVTTDSFELVAKAWPRLASFSLDSGILTSLIPPSVLVVFARHCPALHTLLLPHMYHREGLLDEELPSQRVLKRLSFFMVERMSIHDPEATGMILWRIFPSLDARACRMLPIHRTTHSDEDNEEDEEQEHDRRMKREVGRDVWSSVLDVVQRTQSQL